MARPGPTDARDNSGASADGAAAGPSLIIKAWGRAFSLYRDDDLEVVRIEVRHGGYSSRHKHLARDNTFLVIAGELIVTVYDDLGDDPLVIYGMQPGQACTVRSGLPHRFRSPQGDSVAFEFYTRPAVGAFGGPQDIVRFDEGGVE